MKRTISTLALAAPLATVALSLGATPAMAQTAGPVKLTQLTEIDDKAPPPHEPDEPNIPDDKAPPPDEPNRPDGPDDFKDKDPCPTHGDCDKDPGDDDEKEPGDGDDKDPGDDDAKKPGDRDDFKKPNRIDAGAGATDDGMQLTWLIAGGGLITATGAAYAVRRRAHTLA